MKKVCNLENNKKRVKLIPKLGNSLFILTGKLQSMRVRNHFRDFFPVITFLYRAKEKSCLDYKKFSHDKIITQQKKTVQFSQVFNYIL